MLLTQNVVTNDAPERQHVDGASSTSGNLQGVTYKPAATTYSGGLFANANCAPANSNRPDVTYGNAQEARENPPVFFRRALKIVDGASLNHRNLLQAAPTSH